MKKHKRFSIIEIKGFTLFELIVTLFLIFIAIFGLIRSVTRDTPPPTQTVLTQQVVLAQSDQPTQPALEAATPPTPTPVVQVPTPPRTDWGYVPNDGHTGFWVWSLFFPRITILCTYCFDSVPACTIPFWGKFFMALFIPRVLILVMLAQAQLQTSLWMILHVCFFLMAMFGFVARANRKRD
jgi:hypothetical protein